MSDDRVRVTIAEVPLVVQPAPDELDRLAPARRGERVRPMPTNAEDRAAGRQRVEVVVGGWRFEATVESAQRAELHEKAARSAAGPHAAARVMLRAQIPGRVVRLWVSEGEQVEPNQRLLRSRR